MQQPVVRPESVWKFAVRIGGTHTGDQGKRGIDAERLCAIYRTLYILTMKPYWYFFWPAWQRFRASFADAPYWDCPPHQWYASAAGGCGARDFMARQWRRYAKGGWGAWEEWGPFFGFAGGPQNRFFEFGEVRLALLSLLQEGPKHGYQLIKEMTERSGGVYRASAGTVYPTLQQLEDEGLVQSNTEEGRRIYRLTPEGSNELEREQETVERIWKRAERWGDWGESAGPESFTFFRPLGRLVKATFRAAKWAAGDPEREERLTKILEQTRRSLEDLYER
jgi:DNA-binding PadR family transcriptional regulator